MAQISSKSDTVCESYGDFEIGSKFGLTFWKFIDFKIEIKKRSLEKKISIIAEIKKASPSAGLLINNFNPLNIAKLYIENGASFLSVLTEENFFLGNLEHIKNIKSK